MTASSQKPQIDGTTGPLPHGTIAIVASRYNASICDALVEGAVTTLAQAGYSSDSILVVRVPGAWELPLVVRQLLHRENVIACIALGCVIRGETTHDQHINRAVSTALMQMEIDHEIPIAFGLLTCNTLEQAIQRSGGNVGNKGEESAEAVLELLRLKAKLDTI